MCGVQKGGSSVDPPPPAQASPPCWGAEPPPWAAGCWPHGLALPPPCEPPPPKSPPPEREALVTLAVAHFSEGPTSSTLISTLVPFEPSWRSKLRIFSEPVTMTRWPFCRDSATFSAICRQAAHRRKSASPSFHSFVCLSKVRGVDATVKLATAAPEGVNLSSGSSVRLPMTVMLVSPAMALPFDLGLRPGAVRWFGVV